MPEKSVEFNVNKFVNGSPEKTNTALPMVIEATETSPVPQEATKKTRATKKKDVIDPKNAKASNSMEYLTHNVPYQNSYVEEVTALDEVIAQTNALMMENISEMQQIHNSKTMKNKHGLLIGYTENVTSLINTKMAAIRDKIKIKDTIHNLELKRLKDTKIDPAAQDENIRLQQMYAAFVNAPTMMGGSPAAVLGPSPMSMMMNSASTIQQAIIGDPATGEDLAAWQAGLDPAQKRMMMLANGSLETVLLYDENTGNRRYAAIDKNTGNEVAGIELPDPNTAYDLDVHLSPTSGNWAKDARINKIYPVIPIGGSVINQY